MKKKQQHEQNANQQHGKGLSVMRLALGLGLVFGLAAIDAQAADTTPPTAPTGLTPTVISSTQINLTWNASTDDVGVTGYRVESCAGATCSDFLSSCTLPTGTTFSEVGLTAGTTYRFRVLAVDAAGNLSAYSSIASATTSGGGGGGGEVTVFSDGFESGLNWSRSGDTAWYTGTPKNGTHSVRLRTRGYIQKTVSLSGYQDAKVSFTMGAQNLEGSENVQALYWNGSSWRTLAQINNGSANENGRLNAYAVTLPADVNGFASFALRFRINASSTGDYGFVDDVKVTAVQQQ